MTPEELKNLHHDPDGLLTYEYLANHIGEATAEDLDAIVENLINVDMNGQFLASAARYLNAINPQAFEPFIRRLVAAAIDKDREHRYLQTLMCALYGDNYKDRAEQLCSLDDNFRRLYKRLCPSGSM